MRARLVDTILLSRRGAALCCVILVILLGLNALVFYRNTQTLLDQERLVTHSQQVLTRINGSLVSVTDAVSAQRGYILTGDTAYLRTYTTAVHAVYQGLNRLRSLVSDNHQQSRRLAALRILTDQRLADLMQAIDLERAGQTAQAQNIALVGGSGDALQNAFDVLTSNEIGLLHQRDVKVQTATTTTIVTLILATAVDAALLAGVCWSKRAKRTPRLSPPSRCATISSPWPPMNCAPR
ncbi:MAG: CHASE3 domain-containing protein [Chloroflexi bacterium]|nr:CHASE3 domain-containing protein [Chloroflexota bacterium]